MLATKRKQRGRVNQVPAPEERWRIQARFRWTGQDAPAVIVSDSRHAHWARARDISRNGIGLSVCSPVEPGTTVVIHLRFGSTFPAADRTADVVSIQARGDGTWRVGCVFTVPL